MLYRKLVVGASLAFIASCGGGSGGEPETESTSVVDSSTNVMTEGVPNNDQSASPSFTSINTICGQSFFDRIAGTRTGVLTEIDAASRCQWEITLTLERGGSYPQCKQTGTIDFIGTQTNADSNFVCGSAEGVVASLHSPQGIVEAVVTQSAISSPQAMFIEYETANLPIGTSTGVSYKYPFNGLAEVYIDEDYNLTYSGAEGILERM